MVMETTGMFSKFFRYFLLVSGLPVHYPGQSPVLFAMWYAWRVFIVVRCNVDLVRYVHEMTTRWIFPYSLFGFIDVAVTALVTDSLIGRHARLVRLQRSLLAERRWYRVPIAERCRTRALRALFGTTLLLLVLTLAYSMSIFLDTSIEEPIVDKALDYSSWFHALFLSTTCWITTTSSALYYCAFCSQLKSMFRSVNDRMARLDRSLRRKRAGCFFVGHHLKKIRKKAESSSLPVESEVSRLVLEGGSLLVRFHGVASSRNRLARRIQRLNRRFASAASLVLETDHLFSLQVLVLLSITFLRTCSYIYLFMSSQWPQVDRWATLSVAQQIFFDFLAFGSVALEASLVSEEARKFSSLAVALGEEVTPATLVVQVQRDVCALTVYASDVQLTAWKFFTVSRRFVPTLVGVTATYVMVILQMLQIVHQRQPCHLSK